MIDVVKYLNLTFITAGVLFILLMIVVVMLMILVHQYKKEVEKEQKRLKHELYDEMARQYKELKD